MESSEWLEKRMRIAPRFPRRAFAPRNCLNNLRLIIQPVVLLWSIFPWLQIFPNRDLLLGFHKLIAVVNQFSFVFNTE
jgi:hypothetical protein